MRGFTSLEILITVGIMAVLLGVVVSPLLQTRDARALRETAERVVSLLEQARTKTLAGEGDSNYGIHLHTKNATLFKGSVYSTSAADNIVIPIPSFVSLSFSIGGGSDLIFDRLTGTTQEPGTITLSLARDATKQIIITVPASGIVNF